jgi:hypothetical protein
MLRGRRHMGGLAGTTKTIGHRQSSGSIGVTLVDTSRMMKPSAGGRATVDVGFEALDLFNNLAMLSPSFTGPT